MKLKLVLAVMTVLSLTACSEQESEVVQKTSTTQTESNVELSETKSNVLKEAWSTPFEIPPFDQVSDDDYMPAVETAVASLKAEVAAIVSNKSEPTFENTIVALEKSGSELSRIIRLFSNITGTDTNDQLKALQVKIYPMLTREQDAISLNQELYKRVAAVYKSRDTLSLDQQDARLLELTHLDFVRQGASLDDKSKSRLKEVNAEISEITTKFAQNLLSETKSFEMVVNDEKDLVGLPQEMINAAQSRRSQVRGFLVWTERRSKVL